MTNYKPFFATIILSIATITTLFSSNVQIIKNKNDKTQTYNEIDDRYNGKNC